MARVVTSGAELQTLISDAAHPDGSFSGLTTDWSIDTTARSGAACWRFVGTADRGSYISWVIPSNASTYGRVYINLEAFPASESPAIFHLGPVGSFVTACIDPSGNLLLFQTTTQVGSGFQLSLNQWYAVELFIGIAAGASDSVEMRVDYQTVASATGLNIADTGPTGAYIGVDALDSTSSGNGMSIRWDDLAVNNGSGADQNSWPGEGKVILLKPGGDSQRGSWTGGAGGTTNVYDAINNTPPIGTATETNTTQMESADSSGNNTTDEYRGDCGAPQFIGIGVYDTITVITPICNHGEDVSTNTKTGSFGMQSNPVDSSYSGSFATAFTYGNDAGALGTYPAGWVWTVGATHYNPTVLYSSSIVVGARKTDTGTRVASIDFLGAYMEYVIGGPPKPPMIVPSVPIQDRSRW